MILNRKEWETVDSITAMLLKYRHLFNDREKQAFEDFYGLTIESTQKQAEARRRSAELIKAKRAINKNYARAAGARNRQAQRRHAGR